jgi:hypothetical protein
MNERIRELARTNADYWMNHYSRKSAADMELLRKDVEKFAELIVRECAEQICQGPFYAGAAAKYIKEHFGVE